jgi:UDP-2,4-diacetamido-2,4,6-trideoxy-beta-L-altropyranose hydrolase
MEKKEEYKFNIGIRADGNNELGLGHIIRTMALAKEFQKRHCKVLYWIKKDSNVQQLLKSNNFDVVELDLDLSIEKEIQVLNKSGKENKIDVFIGDAKHINQKYLNKLDRTNKLVVLIDVLRDMKIDADLIINGGIYATEYQKEAQENNRNVLLGAKYNLLREQFNNCKARNIDKKVNNILITMGGSDVLGLTSTFIKYINEFNNKMKIEVVIGNSFVNHIGIKEIANKLPNVYLHYNVKNMAELMYRSDLAISAGGTTLYELSATGTPTLAVIQAENQVLQTNGFQQKGVIVNLGYGKEIERNIFLEEINVLIEDLDKRKTMSELGQIEVDGKGAERCFFRILEEYTRLIS